MPLAATTRPCETSGSIWVFGSPVFYDVSKDLSTITERTGGPGMGGRHGGEGHGGMQNGTTPGGTENGSVLTS